jgi:hypothetical protein
MRNWFVSTTTAVCAVSFLAASSAARASNNEGTLSTYTYGTPPTAASFTNISGQLFINTVVASSIPSANAAGADWEGLNNTPFQSLSFDVQQAPGSALNGDPSFYVIFAGTNANGGNPQDEIYEYFGCHEFSSAVDLGNGFTRYTINQGALSFANALPTPAKVNQIIFHQYQVPPTSSHSVVFGNITLNGTIKPVMNMTPTSCPPVTGDGAGS